VAVIHELFNISAGEASLFCYDYERRLKKFVHSLCVGIEQWCPGKNWKEKNASNIT